MEDLSLHVLDIAQNAILAHARTLSLRVEEDPDADRLEIEVTDDGDGMDEATARAALDPFMTSRSGKRVGLGLPLLAQMAGATGGGLTLESAPGKGTRVRARFGYSHVDRQPLGDMADTVMALIAGCPDLTVRYEHRKSGRAFVLDTAEVRQALGGAPLTHPEVLAGLRRTLREALENL